MLGLFTVLTALFTYPISMSPNSYLNDLTDPRLGAWTLAWNAHAYATDPLGVFNPNIYFPDEATKASSETFLLPSFIVAPFNWAGYPVLAYNLVLLSSFVLSGLGATLWVRHMTGSLGAGIVAGIIWAFAPGKFDQVAHLHMMVGQWIPFALLYCGRYLESGRSRDLYAMSVFAGVQFGFSMHYGVFMVPLLAMYAVAVLALLPESALRANLARFRRELVIAAMVVALLAVAVGLPYWWTHDEVGLRRGYTEILELSGQPDSFVSGSTHNLAPHVAWLYERYHMEDASYFVGVVPFMLAGFGLLVLWPAALRTAWGALPGPGGVRPAPWGRARWWLSRAAAVVAAAAFALHLGGLVATWLGGPGWAALVRSLCVATHPALWAAVAATIALLTMPSAAARGTPRENAYLIVVGYLAVLFYLLAYGPEVQAFGAQLGHGPYWLLYRFLVPFQIIRSAGRIGILWILCVAALVGFALAHFERRWWRAAASQNGVAVRRRWGVALVVLVAALVWEFRVWPLQHHSVDPAAGLDDVWLAEQPGDFAVVHTPIETGRDASQETAYMLGSTLHWKKLVNGYLRFAPPDYRDLAATPQLSPEFFRRLRAGFPVRYLLVHEDRLADDEQRAQFRRLLGSDDDAVFVTQLGYTLVFEVPRDGASAAVHRAAAEGRFGFDFRREYSAEQLSESAGVRFSVKGSRLAATDTVVVLAGWGERKEVVEVTDSWREVRIEVPPVSVGSPRDDPGAFELVGYTLRPVGETGAQVVSGFTIDAGALGTTLGVRDRVFHDTGELGLLVHRLEDFGHGVVETRRFAPTAAGAAQMHEYVQGLPEGALTAVSATFESFRVLDPDAVGALRLIGAAPPKNEETLLFVALGVRGADPGTALQHVHHTRAYIDIEAPTPVLQVRQMSLY